MLLAVIPARGGSKGIPRKNLTPLAGKPLIQYSIEAAQGSAAVDEILLSTDDEEIAELGVRFGLRMDYRRPDALAEDTTSMIDTLVHGIEWFKSSRPSLPTEILLLQPTSPLRISADIDGAVELFKNSQALSVVGAHKMVEHPFECIFEEGSDWDYLVQPPKGASRRQDYGRSFYFINGSLYLSSTADLLRSRTFIHRPGTVFYKMPRDRGVDIDYPIDLSVAESLLIRGRL